MVKVLGILCISILIALKEIPPLKKQQQKKEIWIIVIFLFFASAFLSLVLLEVKIPSPLEVIRVVYHPFSNWLFSLLS
jgi:hypothetical protein